MCLQSHYHKQLVFTFENMDVAENTYKKLVNKIASIKSDGELDKEKFNEYNNKFIGYISDDLNTANAVSVLYELLKDDMSGKTKLKYAGFFFKKQRQLRYRRVQRLEISCRLVP